VTKVGKALTKNPKIGVIDPNYETLKKTGSGKRLLTLLRCLFAGTMTVQEVAIRINVSETYVKKLAKQGKQKGFIDTYYLKGGKKRSRGRPVIGIPKKNGRPNKYLTLTLTGKDLLKNDQEIREHWSQVAEYKSFFEKTDFDVFDDLGKAICDNHILGQFLSTNRYEPLMGNFYCVIFRPFVLNHEELEKRIALYDELVNLIEKIVPPDFILPYYLALREWNTEIDEIISGYKLLMSKMETLLEVQRHLKEKQNEKGSSSIF
jgi:hypothetical protein